MSSAAHPALFHVKHVGHGVKQSFHVERCLTSVGVGTRVAT